MEEIRAPLLARSLDVCMYSGGEATRRRLAR